MGRRAARKGEIVTLGVVDGLGRWKQRCPYMANSLSLHVFPTFALPSYPPLSLSTPILPSPILLSFFLLSTIPLPSFPILAFPSPSVSYLPLSLSRSPSSLSLPPLSFSILIHSHHPNPPPLPQPLSHHPQSPIRSHDTHPPPFPHSSFPSTREKTTRHHSSNLLPEISAYADHS